MEKLKIEISEKSEKIILILLILITFIRVIMWFFTPIYIYSVEKADDGILYEYASQITSGNWLGTYDQLRLCKAISFSFFEAICNKLMIPYTIGLAILNILSALLICKALSPKINKKWLFLCYIVILFSPTGFTTLISQRNYRNAIIPFAVLLAFGGYIGLFLRRNQNVKNLYLWSIISGISLSFFWFLKEDSIWIAPFVGTISLLILIWIIIFDRKNLLKKSISLIIPIAICLIFGLLICFMNNKYYGIFDLNDKSNSDFGKMMTNLFSIEDDKPIQDKTIWVTQNMMEKAYNVSPTLSELKQDMEVCKAYTNKDDEVPGDYIVWKIRYIMSVHGYYDENAVKSKEFCEKVNRELEDAFNNGTLIKDRKIHIASQIKGLTYIEIWNLMPKSVDWLWDFSKYDDCGIVESKNSGTIDEINEVQKFLRLGQNNSNNNFSIVVKNASNIIVNIYKTLAVPTNILAIIGYIAFTVCMLAEMKNRNFEKLNLWFIMTGVFLSSIVLCFELNLFLSFFEEKMLITYRTFYAAGVFPLIEIFKCISIYVFICLLINFIKKYSKKDEIEIKSE